MKLRLFKDYNINQKLVFSYITMVVIPIVLLGILSFNYSKKFLEQKVTNSFRDVNSQIVENLDTFFKNMANISLMPYYDYNVKKIMEKDYSRSSNGDYERITDYDIVSIDFFSRLFLINDFIDSLYLHQSVSNLTYTRGYSASGNISYANNNLEWYDDVIKKNGEAAIIGIHKKIQSSKDDNYVITVGRSIVKPFKRETLGIFLVNVKPERLKELYKEVTVTPGVKLLMVDENNRIVYSSDESEIGSPMKMALIENSDSGKVYTRASINGEKVLVVSNTSMYSSWKVISIIPEKELFSDITLIRNITFLLGAAIILLAVIVSFFIANGISRPIMKLRKLMKQVENGNLEVNLDIQSNDEIGHLSKTFNKMINEIKSLLNKTLVESEKKRIAELQALQSQINPHFMYNTLNVIKWMAQMQAADNITGALDAFIYLLNFAARTKEEFIPIRDEVEFIKNYVMILKLRYYNKFNVEYEISEEVYNYRTLKFLLQPFVENAVFHGFGDKKNNNLLIIKAFLSGEFIVFKVIDDGVGMSKDLIDRVTAEDGVERKGFNSIGIFNVIERIKLHFGTISGVKIESVTGEGTEVTITVPAQPM